MLLHKHILTGCTVVNPVLVLSGVNDKTFKTLSSTLFLTKIQLVFRADSVVVMP